MGYTNIYQCFKNQGLGRLGHTFFLFSTRSPAGNDPVQTLQFSQSKKLSHDVQKRSVNIDDNL